MSRAQIAAVMIHVPDPEQALAWYEKAFPTAKRQKADNIAFEFLVLGNVQIEVVQADEKVSSGPSGTVVYWWVENLAGAVAHLESIGARLYRGPMRIEREVSMCQVQDPWNNCIGLRGPSP